MRYKYVAKTSNGVLIKGSTQSDSIEELALRLREKKVYLMKIRSVKNIGEISSKPSLKTISMFCKQFSLCIKAGISICDILNLLNEQMTHKSIKKSLIDICENVKKGNSLHESMKKTINVYPRFMINMIYLGEESGRLDIILEELAEYYEKEHKLLKRFTNSMIYPSIVFITLMIVSMFLMIKVIPVFITNLNSLDAEIPLITQIVLGTSSFLQHNLLLILLVISSVGFILLEYFKTERGKIIFCKFLFICPILGPVYRRIIYTRFSRGLNILLSSGVGLIRAFEIINDVIGDRYFKLKLKIVFNGIEKGEDLSSSINAMNLFPQFFVAMIKIGEETGTLDGMFLTAADIFYEDAQENVDKATVLLEPILIIFLGLMIGIIILAAMLPMLNVMDSAGKL
ncbi:type II secretion system F family protein [Clostridium estertheticum]|uniref:Type II secretion system F family protein n=1 Tax=Clostridium estertheticum TaxID=238834 RepID=A0A7Y3SVH9_9CLOT|nr:type II secretion system F family protein [Clostridium estertheticum]NNU76121.1 type II secretion system F family protein [Clostridium estertheticum]WBL46299.1 type II secretion system F family protein [Clostridium estertheticum]